MTRPRPSSAATPLRTADTHRHAPESPLDRIPPMSRPATNEAWLDPGNWFRWQLDSWHNSQSDAVRIELRFQIRATQPNLSRNINNDIIFAARGLVDRRHDTRPLIHVDHLQHRRLSFDSWPMQIGLPSLAATIQHGEVTARSRFGPRGLIEYSPCSSFQHARRFNPFDPIEISNDSKLKPNHTTRTALISRWSARNEIHFLESFHNIQNLRLVF